MAEGLDEPGRFAVTFGLAFGNQEKIIAAVDSAFYGASDDEIGRLKKYLPEKLVRLPDDVLLMVSGYLNPWGRTLGSFLPVKGLGEIARHLARTLYGHLSAGQVSYGLVCGYEEQRAVCYRISCQSGTAYRQPHRVGLDKVQPLGDTAPQDPWVIAQRVQKEIENGEDAEAAIRTAIEACESAKIGMPVICLRVANARSADK